MGGPPAALPTAPETALPTALETALPTAPETALPTTPELLRLGRRAGVSARERAVAGAEEVAPLCMPERFVTGAKEAAPLCMPERFVTGAKEAAPLCMPDEGSGTSVTGAFTGGGRRKPSASAVGSASVPVGETRSA